MATSKDVDVKSLNLNFDIKVLKKLYFHPIERYILHKCLTVKEIQIFTTHFDREKSV